MILPKPGEKPVQHAVRYIERANDVLNRKRVSHDEKEFVRHLLERALEELARELAK